MAFNKKYISKIAVITIFLITILSNTSSIAFDDQEKNLGQIKVKINDETLGTVTPTINITENQTIFFNLTKDQNGSYNIDETIKLKINTSNNNKTYPLGRYLTSIVSLIRLKENENAINIFNPDFLNKIIWTYHRVNIIEKRNSSIKLPLQYKTKNQQEKIILIILTVGSPGLFYKNQEPFFDFKTTELDFIYGNEVKIDTRPPETSCLIQEI